MGSEARAQRMSTADTDLQLFNEAERGRLLQKQKKRRLQGREDDVCDEISGLIVVFPLLSFFFCLFAMKLSISQVRNPHTT